MWIDRAKEAKKRSGLSNRDISIETKGKLSERDVMRLLNGEYKKPSVDDVITLGAALKLSPAQLFEDSSLVVETRASAEESNELKEKNIQLTQEIEKLKSEIAHKDELLKAKDELIAAKDETIAAKNALFLNM